MCRRSRNAQQKHAAEAHSRKAQESLGEWEGQGPRACGRVRPACYAWAMLCYAWAVVAATVVRIAPACTHIGAQCAWRLRAAGPEPSRPERGHHHPGWPAGGRCWGAAPQGCCQGGGARNECLPAGRRQLSGRAGGMRQSMRRAWPACSGACRCFSALACPADHTCRDGMQRTAAAAPATATERTSPDACTSQEDLKAPLCIESYRLVVMGRGGIGASWLVDYMDCTAGMLPALCTPSMQGIETT